MRGTDEVPLKGWHWDGGVRFYSHDGSVHFRFSDAGLCTLVLPVHGLFAENPITTHCKTLGATSGAMAWSTC